MGFVKKLVCFFTRKNLWKNIIIRLRSAPLYYNISRITTVPMLTKQIQLLTGWRLFFFDFNICKRLQ
jgi:hypothetical protein